jgi:hypothetical protein
MMVPTVRMAKLLTDVKPPISIAAGSRQALKMPNTRIQTMQPETVPAFVNFMVSPLSYQYQRENLYSVSSYSAA